MLVEFLAFLGISIRLLDWVFSWIVGFASDSLHTPIGGRKPFILIGTPCLVVGLERLINLEAESVYDPHEISVDGELLQTQSATNSSCSDVRILLREAGASLELEFVRAEKRNEDGAEQNQQLELDIAVGSTLYSLLGMTLTYLPCRALGLDLARNDKVRQRFFAMQEGFALCAAVVLMLLQMFSSICFPTNISKQIRIMAHFGIKCLEFSFLPFLFFASSPRTRATAHLEKRTDSFIQKLKSFISNAPFRQYVFIQLMVVIAIHLSHSVALFYIKYEMHTENSQAMMAFLGVSIIVFKSVNMKLATSTVASSTAVRTLQRYPVVFVLGHFLFFLLSPSPPAYQPIYLFCFFPAYHSIIPTFVQIAGKHVMSQLVDYDRLRSGANREALFTVVDHSILQMLDIFIGALPLYMLGSYGFRNNGGCICGCGVECTSTYKRWDCPEDVGWACTRSMNKENLLFFGNPTRQAPCTWQNAGVSFALRLLFFIIPLVAMFGVIIIASHFALDYQTYQVVTDQLKLRLAGRRSYDPIELTIIDARLNSSADMLQQHERQMLEKSRGYAMLKASITLGIWRCGFVASLLLVAIHFSDDFEATNSVVRWSLFALLPLNAALLIYLLLKLKMVSDNKTSLALFSLDQRAKGVGDDYGSSLIQGHILQGILRWSARGRAGLTRPRSLKQSAKSKARCSL
mmetsp:Transcript_29463/g.75993  ORF Transcript_29463/g.75993 Transcript_29463/m.75993 type:complete len:688 (+) Transcript_29463:275-2338(+)